MTSYQETAVLDKMLRRKVSCFYHVLEADMHLKAGRHRLPAISVLMCLNPLESVRQYLKIVIDRHSLSNLTELQTFFKEEWTNNAASACAKQVETYSKTHIYTHAHTPRRTQ